MLFNSPLLRLFKCNSRIFGEFIILNNIFLIIILIIIFIIILIFVIADKGKPFA